MIGWRNLPIVKQYQRMGYTVSLDHPRTTIYALIAQSPTCKSHRLQLVFDGSKLVTTLLERSPVGRQRKWREVDPRPQEDWSKVPAAWFRLKAETYDKQEVA